MSDTISNLSLASAPWRGSVPGPELWSRLRSSGWVWRMCSKQNPSGENTFEPVFVKNVTSRCDHWKKKNHVTDKFQQVENLAGNHRVVKRNAFSLTARMALKTPVNLSHTESHYYSDISIWQSDVHYLVSVRKLQGQAPSRTGYHQFKLHTYIYKYICFSCVFVLCFWLGSWNWRAAAAVTSWIHPF